MSAAVFNDPAQPYVTGAELQQLTAFINEVMRSPREGVALELGSPNNLDSDPSDRSPLPAGVRRMILIIDRPAGIAPSIPDHKTLRLIFKVYVVGNGPTLQLDAETLLRWAALVEEGVQPAHDASADLIDRHVLAAFAKKPATAREVSESLSGASRAVNKVADAVRSAVADTSTWLPIKPEDIVVATVALYRAPSKGNGR